ncbi:hypothetical protein [Snodgrassella sp. CFCC 13594]|uniref:hypothetical protein n=1 Tax=Snodgrassella sp. CFCC 13594 TaxID=1775559 RepID=UPI000833EBA7|nr:hypothetical protein [Snodgrassella sp. CFCC 13594]
MKKIKPNSRFFIIGNALEQRDISHLIQNDDIVIRFNDPNPTCQLMADWVFIANGYTQIRHLTIDRRFFKTDTLVFFRYQMADILHARYQNIPLHKRVKYLWRFPKWKKHFGLDQYPTQIVPFDVYRHCAQVLGYRQPSTGLLAIDYVLLTHPHNHIYVHNFTNEGWVGHNWDDEKRIMKSWLDEGIIEEA